MIKIEGDKAALFQWDLNQRVVLTDIDFITAGIEVHFESTNEECCLGAPSYIENDEVYADIPNKLLQQSGVINVYLYVQDENKAWTEYRTEILIIPRKKPFNYVYTPNEVYIYKQLEERLEEVEKKAEGKFEAVKTINSIKPDENGNIDIDTECITDEEIINLKMIIKE